MPKPPARVSAKFLKSTTELSQFPPSRLPEVAFVGRSNVGKSSLINKLMGATVARVSSTPGRTREINFFEITMLPAAGPAADLMVADLPGYGYAKVARKMMGAWRVLIDDYLNGRDRLGLCVVLVDANLPAQELDQNLLIYLRDLGREVMVVATKADRLPSSRRLVILRDLGASLGVPLVGFSSKTGDGREEVWDRIRKLLPRRKS